MLKCPYRSLVKNKCIWKKIVFPGHNIPWGSQISVSFVSPGREPWEIAKIRETHGKFVRVDGFGSPQCNKVVTDIFVKLDYCIFGVPYHIPSQCTHAVSALAVSMPVWPRTTKLYLQSLRKSLCNKVVSATYNLFALKNLQWFDWNCSKPHKH